MAVFCAGLGRRGRLLALLFRRLGRLRLFGLALGRFVLLGRFRETGLSSMTSLSLISWLDLAGGVVEGGAVDGGAFDGGAFEGGVVGGGAVAGAAPAAPGLKVFDCTGVAGTSGGVSRGKGPQDCEASLRRCGVSGTNSFAAAVVLPSPFSFPPAGLARLLRRLLRPGLLQ